MNNVINQAKHAKIDLVGATCTSCSIAVEHMGEKLDGIDDIWVDKVHSCIHIDYNGDTSLLDKICEFVQLIGYQASVVEH